MNNGKNRNIFYGFKSVIRHSLFFILIPIILYSLFFILPTKALAATVTWDGGAGGSWNTAANWSNDIVPTSSDDVTIDNIVKKSDNKS